MFSSVLVPIDVRFLPRLTLVTAATLASEQNARLTLLYVADTGRDFQSAAYTAVSSDDVDLYGARIRQFLGNAASIVEEYGGNAATLIARGSPVHRVIKAVAVSLGADVIVMGTHGRRGLAHALSGSVTEDVLRDANIPVLVIHESRAIPHRKIDRDPLRR
jgi:nucleotide-binding universal stress UspA family protein